MSLRKARVVRTASLCLVVAQAALWASASDVSVYLVKKGLEYTQTDSGSPSVNPTNRCAFEVDVVMAGVNTVKSASVHPPGVPFAQLALSTGNKWSYRAVSQ
jgi:hypothetical protein